MIFAWLLFVAIVGGMIWLLRRPPKELDQEDDKEQAEYIREWQRSKADLRGPAPIQRAVI